MNYIDRNFLEDAVLELAEIIKENRELIEENDYLKSKLRESEERTSRMLIKDTNQIANILNTAMNNLK